MKKGTVVITTEEYRSLLHDSFMLEELKKYCIEKQYVFREDVLKKLGVLEPLAKMEKAGEE